MLLLVWYAGYLGDTAFMRLGEVTEPIRERDTSGELLTRLAHTGADLLVRTMDGIESGELAARPQEGDGTSYASKLTPADAGRLEVYLDGDKIFDRKDEDGVYPNLTRANELKMVIAEKIFEVDEATASA
jgi:methionyl-tRNA formyltransferase